VGGIPELVEDGAHALLTPPGDIEALATALANLCQNLELAQRLGEEAQKRVAKDFTIQSQVNATQRAYCKAWQRAQRRLNPSGNFSDSSSIRIQP